MIFFRPPVPPTETSFGCGFVLGNALMDTFNKLCLHKQRSDYFPIKRGRSTLFTVVPVNEAPVVCGANQDLVSVDLLPSSI